MAGQRTVASVFALVTGWCPQTGECEDLDEEERLKEGKQKPGEPDGGRNVCELIPWPRPEP